MWRGLCSAALGGLGCAAAARGCNRGIESLGTTEKYRQIRWRKALYLEGKTRLTTSNLSPAFSVRSTGLTSFSINNLTCEDGRFYCDHSVTKRRCSP